MNAYLIVRRFSTRPKGTLAWRKCKACVKVMPHQVGAGNSAGSLRKQFTLRQTCLEGLFGPKSAR